MKQLVLVSLLGMSLFSQPLYAADKDNNKSFWDSLRGKIESLTPQKKLGVTTATGGVRGAPVATEDMYWKNEASAQIINPDELDAFAKAMKLVDSDDKAPAQTAFSEFVKKYPASSLRKDADQALVLLQSANVSAK